MEIKFGKYYTKFNFKETFYGKRTKTSQDFSGISIYLVQSESDSDLLTVTRNLQIIFEIDYLELFCSYLLTSTQERADITE